MRVAIKVKGNPGVPGPAAMQRRLAVLAILALPASVQAGPVAEKGSPRDEGIVVDQQPTRYGGPASDTLFRNEFGDERWQQLADNILLDEAATIRRITWWGFYGGSGTPATPPPETETMRIRFYSPRPGDGLPGEVLWEENFLDPSRAATGLIVLVGGRPKEYIYEANLAVPMSLAAQTPYWLEIVQVGDVDSHFRWEDGFSGHLGFAYLNEGTGDWWFAPFSYGLSFQLSAIPEPGTAVLMVLGAVAIRRRRRKEDAGG
jgi:hypothetical protein